MLCRLVARLLAPLPLLAIMGCASPKMIDTGRVTIVEAEALPAPQQADLIVDTRPQLIGPGDVISVEVFGLSELSREVRVDSDGHIALPLAGALNVSGLNPETIARDVETRLQANFVRDPRVSVGIVEAVSQVVTVDGEVNRPGAYPVTGESTLMRAIARAQGASVNADAKHVVIFRTVEGQQMAALYDLRAIRLGAYADPQVYPNDVVVVGESTARRIFPVLANMSSLLISPLVAILNR
jgi:polysaccharide export outer membrane protein